MALVLGGCLGGDNLDPDDAAEPDATVTASPPHEQIPPECLGPDYAGPIDAGPPDAETDAELATHPPNPLPCSRTCVGSSCALCDAGVDAP
jgi:hypothetical protein